MNHPTTTTAVIYTRVSFADQVEGTSLDSQERLCHDFAERNRLNVLAVFVERGESAKTADRTELNKAIAFCKRNRVGYFIVHKLDRFARNQTDHVTVRAILRKAGTELRSVTEPIDDSPTGRAMEGMLSVFAEFDNNVRTERVKQGMLERVRKGVWVWQAPIGYLRPVPKANLVPDPDIAPLIHLAFEEFKTGVYTYHEVAKRAAARGFRLRCGKPPSAEYMRKILSNPVYAGIIEVWGERFEASFPPIVSRDLFYSCQPQQPSPQPSTSRRGLNNPLFPLRGLASCDSCGGRITGSRSRGKLGQTYPYYHHQDRSCPSERSIPKTEFEAIFLDYLQSLACSPETAVTFMMALLEVLRSGDQALEERNAQLKKQITELEGERQRVFELHLRGVYSDSDFLDQKRAVEDRIEQKKLLLTSRADLDKNLAGTLTNLATVLSEPAGEWMRSESDYKRRIMIQQRLFPKGLIFDGERFRTPCLGLMYQLKESFQGDKNRLVAHVSAAPNDLLDELRGWNQIVNM